MINIKNRKFIFISTLIILFLFPENKQSSFYLYNVYAILAIYYIVFIFDMKKIIGSISYKASPLLYLCLISTISSIWSIDRKNTLVSAAVFIGTTMLAIYIANNFSLECIITLFTSYFLICAVLSLIAVILIKDIGIFYDEFLNERVWVGIYNNRNTLGINMSMGAITSLFYIINSKNERISYKKLIFGSIALILCITSLIFCGSKTGAIVFLIIALGIFIFRPLIKNIDLIVIIIILLIAIILINSSLIGEFLNVLGRDSSLSGRTSIWQYSIEAIKRRLFLGYGYNSFWTYKYESIANIIRFSLDFYDLTSTHNGFIGLALDLGLLGVCLYICFIYSFFRNAIYKLNNKYEIKKLFPIMCIVFTIIYNMSEQVLIKPCSIFWVLQVISYMEVIS